MNIPQRWQRSRKAGAKQPESCRYVGRGTKHGNEYRVFKVSGDIPIWYVENFKTGYMSLPFYSQKEANAHAVMMYHIPLHGWLDDDPTCLDMYFDYEYISCFCPLDMPCHCDAIIEHLTKRAAELEKILQNAV